MQLRMTIYLHMDSHLTMQRSDGQMKADKRTGPQLALNIVQPQKGSTGMLLHQLTVQQHNVATHSIHTSHAPHPMQRLPDTVHQHHHSALGCWWSACIEVHICLA